MITKQNKLIKNVMLKVKGRSTIQQYTKEIIVVEWTL